MFCKNCGAALPDGAKFCGSCGNPVVAEAVEEVLDGISENITENVSENAAIAGEQINNAADEINGSIPAEEIGQVSETVEEAAESAEEYGAGVTEDATGHTTVLSHSVEQAEEGIAANDNADAQTADHEELNVVSAPVYSDPDASYGYQNEQNGTPYYGETVPEQNTNGYGYNGETEPLPAKPEKPVKQKKEKTHKKVSVWAHILSVFICILLFAFIVATVAVATVQKSVTENTIKDAINRTDIDAIKVSDLLDKKQISELGLNVKGDNDTLIDVIYDNIDQSRLSHPLSKDEFIEIAHSEELRDFVASAISKRAAKVLNGDRTDAMDVEEIISFVKENKASLSKITGYEITAAEIENLRGMLNDNYKETISKLEIQPMNEYMSDGAASAVRLVSSTWVLIVLLVVVVLLAVLIFLIVRSFKVGCMYNGVTFVIAGLPFLLAAAAFSIGLIKIQSDIGLVQVLTLAAGAISKVLLILGAIVVAIGAVLIIASCIARAVQKKKQRKAA